ncbi:MAG: roadblock/LC7 domain-containing protein [Candidatus Thermoplasmatota archaeon]
MPRREEVIKEVLETIKKVSGVENVAVITMDGTVMGSDLSPTLHSETFGIMCATMFGAAVTANAEIERPLPNRIVSESDKGILVINHATSDLLIVVNCKLDTSFSELGKEIEKSIKMVSEGF